jgi:diaminopimelate epimerase
VTSEPVLSTPRDETGRDPQPFLKVEGLGNDFLLIDLRPAAALDLRLAELQRRAPELCDRRTGVGGDGLLIIAPPGHPDSTATMIVINHDGSRPEMCGNGLRCVALYLAERPGPVQVDTDAGPRACSVRAGEVEVDMGLAVALGERTVAGRRFLAYSLGNPHAVAFVGPDEDPEQLARQLGPEVERDPQFPARTNVEFARREPDGSLTLWVWERGCGITAACGTGACAALAAAVAEQLAPRDTPVRVRLPGGSLTVRLTDHRVWMTGPARVVFRGVV